MILIGDPKQLPSTTFSSDSNFTKYNRSLFERIIANKVNHYFLDTQYRMQPLIRQFPSETFYFGKLKDGIKDRVFPVYLKSFMDKNIIFIDIKDSSEEMIDKSYRNQKEC